MGERDIYKVSTEDMLLQIVRFKPLSELEREK